MQRVIIVGDPNQLPPIGRGKVFADIIDWLRTNHPASVGELAVNLRQMENRISGKGTGIIDLASVYVRQTNRDKKDEEESLRAEEMFKRLQDLPPDGKVDTDLRVVFWKDADDLMNKLVARMIADMEEVRHQCCPCAMACSVSWRGGISTPRLSPSHFRLLPRGLRN